MAAYGGIGLAVGLVFGAIALYLVYPQPMPLLVAREINEIVFPIGCSIVIYASDVFGRRAKEPLIKSCTVATEPFRAAALGARSRRLVDPNKRRATTRCPRGAGACACTRVLPPEDDAAATAA